MNEIAKKEAILPTNKQPLLNGIVVIKVFVIT